MPPATIRLAIAAVVLAAVLPACRRDQPPKPPPNRDQPAENAESIRDRYLTLMNVGKAHYENRAAPAAIKAFEQAVELLPTETASRLNLARACVLDSRFERAVTAAEAVIRLDRYQTAAYYLAGIAYLQLGDAPHAVARLERAARDDPAVPAAHFQLASALQMDDRTERAAQEFRVTLQRDPDHWSAHFKLAAIAQRARDVETYQHHIAEFQRLRRNMPDDQRAPDYWRRCKYTDIQVPTEIHQPDPVAIDVRFTHRALNLNLLPDPRLRALAVMDIDNDGNHDFLTVDDWGRVRLAGHTPAGFELLPGAIGTISAPHDHIHCRAADFDNDGLLDMFLFSPSSSLLVRQSGPLQFADVTTSAGLNPGGARDAVWIDYDHEGDLDLLIANTEGRLTLWQNLGNASFSDETASAGIPTAITGVRRLWPTDMDNDQKTDVVVTGGGPAWLLHNDGLGEFKRTDARPPWPTGAMLLVEDFDNDLTRDVVMAEGGTVQIVYATGERRELSIADRVIVNLRHFDYDNDGWLDLLMLCGTPGRPAGDYVLRLYRNAGAGGWGDVTGDTKLDAVHPAANTALLTADLDGDGDSDLLLNDSTGALLLYANDGGNAHGQLRLRLTGTRSNKSGIGTLIEISAGSFRLSRTVTELPIEIGVGDRQQLDSVRTIWTNGIVKHDIWVDPNTPLRIEEPFVSAGSCPYLYAWDGHEFRFITDILGTSPLGLSLKRGSFVPADTDEFVWVGDQDTFRPRQGRYLIRITDELREILYLDHVRLLAVDHPADREIHPTSKLRPPPFPDAELLSLRSRRDLLNAVDDTGRDWTDELLEIDGDRTEPPTIERPQLRGRAGEHALVLDFGRLDASTPWALVMTGWLMWGDAGVNVAAAQNPDLPDPWPRLDAWTSGHWEPVPVTVGAPAGKPKTIVVDLAGRLPLGVERLRLTTAFEIYWDRIAIFERETDPTWMISPLTLASANLRWWGFPQQIRPGRRQPVLPDTGDIRSTPPWRRPPPAGVRATAT